MTLNSVVLPAPFGPIRPVMAPCCAARLTSVRALTPPNRTATPATRSTASPSTAWSPDGSRSAADVDKARLLLEEHGRWTGRLRRDVRRLRRRTVRSKSLGDLRHAAAEPVRVATHADGGEAGEQIGVLQQVWQVRRVALVDGVRESAEQCAGRGVDA